MDLILASRNGEEERVIIEDFDIDIGNTNDFQISLPYSAWTGDLQFGKRIYIPGTEIGGIIRKVSSATNMGMITVSGYVWLGYLDKRIIIPPAGQDYYIANGDLNDVVENLTGGLPIFHGVTKSSGYTVNNYQFKRYCTVLSGVNELLQSVGYRLELTYRQTQHDGYVEIQCVPIKTYGEEFSQDAGITFQSTDNRMGVNHLICLGQGELAQRMVVHLYASNTGVISQSQSQFGMEEIVDVFDYSSAPSQSDLIKYGKDRMKEVMSKKTFDADVNDTDVNLKIGDIVSGRDYITGNLVKKQIIGKVVTRRNGVMNTTYRIEGSV